MKTHVLMLLMKVLQVKLYVQQLPSMVKLIHFGSITEEYQYWGQCQTLLQDKMEILL